MAQLSRPTYVEVKCPYCEHVTAIGAADIDKWSDNGVMDTRCWEHEGGCGQRFFVKAELVISAQTYRMDNGGSATPLLDDRIGHYDRNGNWTWDSKGSQDAA